MKTFRVLALLATCLCFAFVGAKFAGPVGEANKNTLEQMGFVIKNGDMPGAPARASVSSDTIKKLQKFMKQGKILLINDSGELEIE